MRGILIAYSFHPNQSVGSLRPTYWAEEISKIGGVTLDVVTATEPSTEPINYKRTYVKNESISVYSSLIKDEGLTWKKDLLNYFKKIDMSQYDFAIITGGPFFHFSIGKYLKRKGLKIIYDYRDPFSYNPRFNEKGIKKFIKKKFERGFLKVADAVITVNDACHEFIGNGMDLNRKVISNGYDERAVNNLGPTEITTDFFYGGKFYWQPNIFFDVLLSEKYSLSHAGNPVTFSHPFLNSSNYLSLGYLEQKDLYVALNRAEIGVIFTMNVPFESTTKIYDYIALNKKILVITQGEPHVGVLKRELDNYPMYRWVKNNETEIKKAILELKSMDDQKVNSELFTRKAGLLKLVDLIEELCA